MVRESKQVKINIKKRNKAQITVLAENLDARETSVLKKHDNKNKRRDKYTKRTGVQGGYTDLAFTYTSIRVRSG